MPTLLSDLLKTALSVPGVSSIRRNHGLEHATLHVLAERNPNLSMAGHSNASGFWLIGNVPTEEVRSAVNEALQRMHSGEHKLAVHANCGTNFVTAGTVAGVAGALAMFGVGRDWKSKVERLPLAATLATLGLILSQPLGLKIQENVTTSGVPGTLRVVDIIPSKRGRVMAHRVVTRG
ncbi:MAG: hypothetical protein EHM70_11160 [Chloroflexota bacterium]|nr:MAG: hypothetical protein EHM70_11160 [Chloroflexota bacterium]